jgi:hypothetical protein
MVRACVLRHVILAAGSEILPNSLDEANETERGMISV